jgi:hypothetical protein
MYMNTEEIMWTILGLAMLYTIVHFIVISFTKVWKERTVYEKVITIIAILSVVALYFGSE